MLTHRNPSACQGCELAQQSINGLYCTQLKCYVEHQHTKPCDKDERDEERKTNTELRKKYTELDERMTRLDLQYKRDISRLGRRIDVLSPFLCGVAGCMNRKKVSMIENIDDNSFATCDDKENI